RTIRAHRELVRDLVAKDRVQEVLLAGSPPSKGSREEAETWHLLRSIGCSLVRTEFNIPADSWPKVMSSAHAALLPEPLETIHKSGIYASCVGCGLWCVLPQATIPASNWPIGQQDLRECLRGRERSYLKAWQEERSELDWRGIASQWMRLLGVGGCG
ncbi:MAG: hypothetical protein N2109_12450, partial [Fimbriimonadales bacterium]|nr:hypothetical protein [Fimbriimonadales bacterium]